MPDPRPSISLRTLRAMARRGEPFACLTCYDASTARYLAEAGVHVLLVGDTAAEVILGYDRTIDMPLDVLVELTAAVKRGAPSTVVMADMPFLSYHTTDARALRNAGRFMTQGRADIVKLEADASFAPLVRKLARAGIPVCAHVGSRPQLSALAGGYASAGRTPADADRIVHDALELERAGAVMLLIEAVPEEVTARVMEATTVPLIGIGAGDRPHGQVLVLHDLVGMSKHPPRFASPVADLGAALRDAGREWVSRVTERRIGGERYTMQTSDARPPDGTQSRAGVESIQEPKRARRTVR